MNKQFHVHSVNQWVACRQEPESMSSSLIDRLYRHHHINMRYIWTRRSLVNKTGWRTLAFLWMCECVRKGFPTAPRLRPRPCLRPVAPLAATGVTPHSYQTWYACSVPARRRLSAVHTQIHIRTLNYHGAALVKLLCIWSGIIDIFY